jgi:hypothetical protein
MQRLALWTVLAIASAFPVKAAVVTAAVTADNHYGLYYGSDSSLTFVGRNEYGVNGSPGQYNWSLPESFGNLAVAGSDRFYIAQWDQYTDQPSTAQGLLAEFVTADGRSLLTNTRDWAYFVTSAPNPGDYGDPPDALTMEALLVAASWTQVGFATPNGTGPWDQNTGPMAGISAQADWISRTSAYDSSYSLVVFRSIPVADIRAVPEPNSIALIILGVTALAASRHRGARGSLDQNMTV